ncbi:LOW QUALITY PROTEIN: hypothetical protein RJ641_020145, partial [Dillenia turbinata]
LSPLTDVTHIFYVVKANKPIESKNCEENWSMLQHILQSIVPNAPNLKHICLETSRKHYLRPYVWENSSPMTRLITKTRLPYTNFYHTLEDILLEEVKNKEGLTWSVCRRGTIFGLLPFCLMNAVCTLCVYATICKHEGKPMKYPGSRSAWECYPDALDADLIEE